MVKKSKLLAALDAYKGRNYKLEKQKNLRKQAAKKKGLSIQVRNSDAKSGPTGGESVDGLKLAPEENSGGWESDESEDAVAGAIDTSRIKDSDASSESSLGDQNPKPQDLKSNGLEAVPLGSGPGEDENDVDDDDDDDEGIPLSDIDSLPSEELADVIPHQRLMINNTTALLKAQKSIATLLSALPFSEHQVITTSTAVSIADVNDDLTRELAFYKQCLDAANEARKSLKKEGVPFSRPNDYFAEMVKSDEHMGKIKQKMTEEAANKKAAAEARKQRDLKKFGKQVQIAKLQERDKAKRETLGKIDLLKRKRKNADAPGAANEEDLFDIALEDAAKTDKSSKPSSRDASGRPTKRRKKDEKFGFGGKKRFSKSGDAVSSGDMRGFSANRMKGGAKRLGKSRRSKV